MTNKEAFYGEKFGFLIQIKVTCQAAHTGETKKKASV